MANKSLIYTNEFPYHVHARTNNKEPFPLPLDQCWQIYQGCLQKIINNFDFKLMAFVLMNNHYHMIGQCSEKYPLDKVMQMFQLQSTNLLNVKSSRINRIYGAPYGGSLIDNEFYFYNVYKYVAQNPLRAGLCKNIESYPYSTFSLNFVKNSSIRISALPDFFGQIIPEQNIEKLIWLNEQLNEDKSLAIKKGLKRNKFKISGRILNDVFHKTTQGKF